MSYTGTKAQSGFGTSIAINSGTISSPIWTTVLGEIVDLNQSGYQNETDDATNLQSTAREFIATILNPGTWDMTINRVSADTGQIALLAAFNSKANTLYKITLPLAIGQTVAGDTYIFTAMVEKYSATIKPDKKISIAASLKVSNAIAFAVGS